jgi:uncharacterized protein YqeY
MEKEVLVNELVEFCFEYGVIEKGANENDIKRIIHKQLSEEEFIENIINTIIARTRTRNDIDTGKIIELLTELEKARLELEYKNHKVVCE